MAEACVHCGIRGDVQTIAFRGAVFQLHLCRGCTERLERAKHGDPGWKWIVAPLAVRVERRPK
jgi:hypothetical protein